MSISTDSYDAILRASIEATTVANAAVAADLKTNDTLKTLNAEDVISALLVVDSQIDTVQTQLDYLIQLNTATDTTTTAGQIGDLQDTTSSILI